MIPVDQTRFDGPAGGNCLAACLASILELPIEDVETPELFTDGVWWAAMTRLLQRHGLQPFSYAPGGDVFPQLAPRGYHIACNEKHATIALDGVIVYDPHPRRTGLKEITEWILLFDIAPEDAFDSGELTTIAVPSYLVARLKSKRAAASRGTEAIPIDVKMIDALLSGATSG